MTVILLLALAACVQATPTPTSMPTPTSTATVAGATPQQQVISTALAGVPQAVADRARIDAWQQGETWIVVLDGIGATGEELGWSGMDTCRAVLLQVDVNLSQVVDRAFILKQPLSPSRTTPLPEDILPDGLVGTPVSGFGACPSEPQGAIDYPLATVRFPPSFPEPNTFCGRVWVAGTPAPDGTMVEAVVEDRVCDRRETVSGQYRVTVVEPYCGKQGSTVRFRVGREWAEQEGMLSHPLMQWYLDLTAGPVLQLTPTYSVNSG